MTPKANNVTKHELVGISWGGGNLYPLSKVAIAYRKGGTTMCAWDGRFNGTYKTSKYEDRSLEDDIMEAGCGRFAYEGPNGELIRETETRIDVWGEGDGKGHYPHHYYNGPDDYGSAPLDRHD